MRGFLATSARLLPALALTLGSHGAAAPPSQTIPVAATANATTVILERRATQVIILSEDGLRPDFVASEHLPWHEALYRRGAYSWNARTIRTASTLPSHASMLSGVDVNVHGLFWNSWRPSRGFIRVPTVFDAAESAGLKTAMFVGKPKLRHIATPGTVDVFERPGYLCKKVALQAAAHIVAERPPLSFVHFSDPDDAGHAYGWASPQYRHAVLQADRCLGILVDALEHAGLFDETLIIISADHGGHAHTHSGSHTIDRVIPWIAHGPGVRAGYNIPGPVSTVDTAATALYALGLPLSSSLAGRPVKEIFSDKN